MRVVMGGESLIGQKTGIGQYADNLSKALMGVSSISDFKFLAHGKLIEPETLLDHSDDEKKAGSSLSLIPESYAKLRGIASQNRVAVWCYWKLMPFIDRYSLREYNDDDIFHSPNYILPRFPGKRVVTVLDLSTVKFPQFHPQARVNFVNRNIDAAVRHADRIITISDFVKQELIELYGISENRISTTYLAASHHFKPVDRDAFNAKISYSSLSYKKYFLFASTIEPRKNLSALLDAYELYRGTAGKKAMPLVIVGHPGWNSEHLHERIKSMEGAGGIKYLGFVPQSQIPSIFAGARALLFPSLYEGFGLPVLEAMQSGTAVLTATNSAMSEVTRNSASLIDINDPESMAQEIGRLTYDDQRIRELEIAGLARSKAFSWDRCAEETLAVYRELAA
jgi:O-antigen biosynthesis alpha-1,3-mannosyltransferase